MGVSEKGVRGILCAFYSFFCKPKSVQDKISLIIKKKNNEANKKKLNDSENDRSVSRWIGGRATEEQAVVQKWHVVTSPVTSRRPAGYVAHGGRARVARGDLSQNHASAYVPSHRAPRAAGTEAENPASVPST